MSDRLGYDSVEVLRANYPDFFWKTVRPYIGDVLRYLRITQQGKQWIRISTLVTCFLWSIEVKLFRREWRPRTIAFATSRVFRQTRLA